MNSNSGFRKTVKKSQWWWRHGTHSLDPGQLARLERERIKRPNPEMFATIQEAFEALRRSGEKK